MTLWKKKGRGWPEGWPRPRQRRGVEVTINRVGSMLTVFFTRGPVTRLEEAKGSDLAKFRNFFQGMLAEGVYLPPSQFEAWFIATAHTQEDLEYTVAAADRVWARAAAG